MTGKEHWWSNRGRHWDWDWMVIGMGMAMAMDVYHYFLYPTFVDDIC
jgi:hypothetical protein